MSFYNIEIKHSEEDFKDQLPDLFKFFIDELENKSRENKQESIEYTFNQVIGYPSAKGQCYEVSYRKEKYSFGMPTTVAYMECHVNENGSFIVDNFTLSNS